MLKILEMVAVVAGLLYVLLVVKQSRYGWIFGGLSSALYVFLYLPKRYFVFAALNAFYVGLAIWGFIRWSAGERKIQQTAVRRMELAQLASYISIAIVASGLLYAALHVLPVPGQQTAFESVAGGAAIAALWATVKKYLENWFFWIFSNGVYVFLFLISGNLATAFLYVAFTMLAIWGYLQWRKLYYSHVE
ncbi:MAG: nicotinamide riboside transporter PnuC [Flavobacteriales bacterium]|nr:nicotinamide riboside transporter PnuC [Flavobacteriales bacterium]MCX7768084.1 nicotinamide riboside transporter PnuC [Flavobacteriales bacterium]MDW8410350.1 nicotinamide riboside transporter PnuC [Flavobacteriales bacterium]